jgi:hypothetical protein
VTPFSIKCFGKSSPSSKPIFSIFVWAGLLCGDNVNFEFTSGKTSINLLNPDCRCSITILMKGNSILHYFVMKLCKKSLFSFRLQPIQKIIYRRYIKCTRFTKMIINFNVLAPQCKGSFNCMAA